MKIKITTDVFNIANRLKSINPNYFIMYNTKTQKFEIHNKQYHNTLCLTLPYDGLDARAITYVLQSEKVEERLQEIEETNLKLEKQEKENFNDKINYQLTEIYKYAQCNSCGFNGDAYKTIWV